MAKHSRRPHKKSRAGCINCKRRKIKCDETKPRCSSCLSFGIVCSWPTLDQQSPKAPKRAIIYADELLPRAASCRRRRGRPRNDWRILPSDAWNESNANSAVATLNMTDTGTHADGLNLEDTELLLHFVQSTAQSLSGGLSPDDRITKFWTTNAPLIGLSYPFVLHLIYALTAYHIAVQCSDEERKLHYKTLASKHLARGTAGLASTTSHLDDNNCGAAYLGATLMCYCNFAAGPSGPEDLMICYLGNKQNIRWINLVSGLRLIREAFTTSALFAGLMSPLSPLPGSPAKKAPQMPLCKKLGQAQLQWHSALADLKRFVILQEGTYAKLCLHPIAELVKLFEGIYGDESGNCGVSQDYQYVLGWLYRLDGEYIQAIRSGDPAALAILTYFAVLLKTVEEWWLKGWAEHVCIAIRDIVNGNLGPLIDWPINHVFCKS